MNCDEYLESIDELVDGTLDGRRRTALERHMSECESCARLADELRQIKSAAAHLPAHQPPARIWEQIATKLPANAGADLARPDAASDGQTLWQRLSFLWQPRLRFAYGTLAVAAAAALLLVVLLPSGRTPKPDQIAARPAAPAPIPASAATPVHPESDKLVQSVETELRMAEQHYQKAITGLEQIAKAGEGTLDPQVATTLRKNVSVIDKAIRESQTALKSQPNSELAQDTLFEAFRRKVALLEDTIALVNEMRKGNQAGAAKAIGNMNKTS